MVMTRVSPPRKVETSDFLDLDKDGDKKGQYDEGKED